MSEEDLMLYLLPLLTSIFYRMRGCQSVDWLGKIFLCAVVLVFLSARYYRFYIWDINCDYMFEKCSGTHIFNSVVIILSLFSIYALSICTIFGSINIYAKKEGAGKLKQSILDWGYKRSIYWTNFVGLSLTALLQLSPLYTVSFWFATGCVLMPLCYTIAVKYLGDTKWAEYMHGFFFGCLMLAAVIGG